MAEVDELRKALKAFRRKLRRMRQDDESRLSRGALTKGHTSAIVGIRPPAEFPNEVWEKLVEQGKLRREGRGMYSLAEDMGVM